jgi:hypothetical protein
MKAILLAVTFGLMTVPHGARAAQEAPPPAVAPPPSAPAPDAAADANAIEAARAAIRAIDAERILRDRDYAAQILAHLDRLAAATDDPAQLAALDSLRLLALPIVERQDETRATLDRVLALRSRDVCAPS